MKNTIRVRRNGATKPASAQTKNTRRTVCKKSAAANKSTGVIILSNEDDSLIGNGIDLTAAEFAAVQKDAAARGESLDAWLMRTFDETPALRSLQTDDEQKSAPVPSRAADNVSLLFFSENKGSSLAQVDLTPAQFAAIQRKASERGIALEQFLNEGVLKILTGAAPADNGLNELEITHIKVNGLIQLLLSKLELLASKGSEFGGRSAMDFVCSVELLADSAKKELDKSFAAVFQAARYNLNEVAS